MCISGACFKIESLYPMQTVLTFPANAANQKALTDTLIATMGLENSMNCNDLNALFQYYYAKDKQQFVEKFEQIRHKVKALHTSDSLIGWCFSKPFGYAGDFKLIDRIYLKSISADPDIAAWDSFAQAQPAAQAVRNRKTYFMNLLKSIRHSTVLNLASGPCRDLKEYLESQPSKETLFTCVDLDKNAIAYAKQLLGNQDNVQFINKNIIALRLEQCYDLIWSAGLFDYFSDDYFIRVLARLFKHVNKGGEIVIGNFSEANPNRAFMEVAMDWQLNHRSEDHLIELALKTGAQRRQIVVKSEKEGINLFLHIRKE